MSTASLDCSSPDVREIVARVRDAKDSLRWVLLTYRDGKPKVEVYESGEGDLDEMVSELDEGKPLFGILKWKIKSYTKFVTMIAGGTVFAGTALWASGTRQDACSFNRSPVTKVADAAKGVMGKVKQAMKGVRSTMKHAAADVRDEAQKDRRCKAR